MADLLVVDNDARIAELVAWFLQKEGHSPRVVTSYALAREALREQRFALMLADLELGVEDGRVELPRLYEEGLLPPTLVVSGYLDAEITAALFETPGILGTVPKPFEPRELLERVEAALQQLGASAPAPEPSPAQEEGAAAPAVEVEEVEARPAEEQLRDFVILAEPPPEVAESKPAEAAAACEEDDEEGWIEICADEPTDTSDWEGAG